MKEEFLEVNSNLTDSSFCLEFRCFACQNAKWLKRTRRGIWQGLDTSPQWPGFSPEPVYVGFVVNEETMHQVCQLFAVDVTPPVVHTHSFIYHGRYVTSVNVSVVKCHNLKKE